MGQEERAESVARDWLTGWPYKKSKEMTEQSGALPSSSCVTLTAARTTPNASLFPQRSISYDKPNGTAIRANIIN